METRKTESQFRPDEIVQIKQWDNDSQAWITRVFPKLSGRLRLAHAENEKVSILTEGINYDGKVAVVKATCTTDKGSFTGTGMSSLERDQKIAPAILEMAESRAIARALRFAGYGVDYCSAEEVSHLEGSGHGKRNNQHQGGYSEPGGNCHPPPPQSSNGVNGRATRNGSNSEKLSQWQHRHLLTLCRKQGRTEEDLQRQCLEIFGSEIQGLTKVSASDFIQILLQH